MVEKVIAKARNISPSHVIMTTALATMGYGSLGSREVATQLKEINTILAEVSKTLAVAVSKVQEHDRRLDNLETLYMRPTK